MTNIIEYILSKHSLTHQELADELNVSTNAVQSWSSARRNPGKNSLKIIRDHYEQDWRDFQNKGQGGKMNSDAMESYVIELQKDKIKLLEQQVLHLEQKVGERPSEKIHFDELVHDYSSVVKVSIGLKGLKRTCISVSTYEPFCRHLGYTLEEAEHYHDIGVESLLKTHRLNEVISQDSMGEIHSIASRFPVIYDHINNIIGNHYMPIPVTWIHKSGRLVHSMTYNSIEWSTKLVTSKIRFLEQDIQKD